MQLAAAAVGTLGFQWMKFSELVRRLEEDAKEVPTGTCHAILKTAGLKTQRTP
jgi:hypothetical protein